MTDRIAGQPPQSPSSQVLRDGPRNPGREVRTHEMAHVTAGAGLVTRGASYEYTTGPDGKRYAVGGEVGIDTSPGRTPEETIDKAARIQAAALAPADPSPQDRQVAAQAAQMAMQARVELASQQGDDGSFADPGSARAPPQASAATAVSAYANPAGDSTPGRVLDLFA